MKKLSDFLLSKQLAIGRNGIQTQAERNKILNIRALGHPNFSQSGDKEEPAEKTEKEVPVGRKRS